jgi:L-alanine-DL-glutamate epimerase-like enolase superfamily enzyme
MKISRITLSHHRLALDPPFHAAWDSRPRRHVDASLIRVETDDGLVGLGSGDAMPGFIGHEELFIGQDPRDLDRHFQIIDNLSFHHGRCWPLDLALWDLLGKITGQPCWRLLGGAQRRIPLYASSGTAREPGAMTELAGRYLNEGFRAMKIRFNAPDWRVEIKRVEAVRDALGERMIIMVDANQAWRMPWDSRPAFRLKDALQLARALERLGVYWLEEPLHRGDLDGMAALRRATDIRIAGAEMAREMHDLEQLIRQHCLDVLQPDATLVGGITGLARIGRQAVAAGLQFTPHSWGNGVGLMANAQLVGGLGGCPWLEFPYDPEGFGVERRDFMLRAPLTGDGQGFLTLPDQPGLGLELDEERLAATARTGTVPTAVAESRRSHGIRRFFDWLGR